MAGIATAAVLEAGLAGGLLVLSSLVMAAALVAWSRPADAEVTLVVQRVAAGALLAVPGLVVIYFAFSGGGFFPVSVGVAALFVALLVVLRFALVPRPLAAIGPWSAVGVGALGLFAAWVFASALWSHAPGRALVEGDRALLYLLTFVLFASLASGRDRLAVAVRVVAGAMALVAGIALLSRVAPDLWGTPDLADPSRLAYPLNYWNALGVLCAIAAVLGLHLSASTDEPRVVRVLAAGALPIVGAALLLTFSRGAAAAAIVGIAAYAILGRPRGLVAALAAAGPATAFAVKAAYDAPLLASKDPTTSAAAVQGHHAARLIAVCSLAALAIRAVLVVAADGRLARMRFPERRRRQLTIAGWAGFAACVLAAVVAFNVPSRVESGWHGFNHESVGERQNTRDRLTSSSNQGRLAQWDAALEGYRSHPITGTGAGTYAVLWNEHRPRPVEIVDAHSLYAETLGELGVVGLILIVVVVVCLLAGSAPVRRGTDRPVYAAVFAAMLAWALHAGIDWDWEMPAVTLWIFILGGLALGRRSPAPERVKPRRLAGATPVVVGMTALALAAVPALVVASQARIDDAVDAYLANDCASAVPIAQRADDVLPIRPQPLEVVAFCRAQAGRYADSLAALTRATERDPDNWALRAWTAAAAAASGRDPRTDLARATRLNPDDLALASFHAAVSRSDRKRWPAVGRRYLRDQGVPQR